MKPRALKKTVAILCLLTFISVAGYYFLFNFIKEKNILIADASVGSQKIEAQESAVKAIQAVLSDSKEGITLVENYFIPKESVVDFIEYVEGLGRRASVQLSIQSVEDSLKSLEVPEKSELRFKITVQGSWVAVYRFLHALEKIPYHIDIKFVDIKKGGADTSLDQNISSGEGVLKVSSKDLWKGSFDFSVLTNK